MLATTEGWLAVSGYAAQRTKALASICIVSVRQQLLTERRADFRVAERVSNQRLLFAGCTFLSRRASESAHRVDLIAH